MYRRSSFLLSGFTMKYKRGTGKWDEDHINDYDASSFMSSRSTMRWYYGMERLQTRNNLLHRRAAQSEANNNGLHHSGRGAFEREAERRGLQVDKYSLTTTTGASRVAELVLLRRAELEKKAAQMMEKVSKSIQREEPSEWFDETNGPLNPRFVERMQSHYRVPLTPLPESPVVRT